MFHGFARLFEVVADVGELRSQVADRAVQLFGGGAEIPQRPFDILVLRKVTGELLRIAQRFGERAGWTRQFLKIADGLIDFPALARHRFYVSQRFVQRAFRPAEFL